MIHLAIQWILVVFAVVFIVYVCYNRYTNLHQEHRRSHSDTYRNAVPQVKNPATPTPTPTPLQCAHTPAPTIDQHAPNGQTCGSPVPPLADPDHPRSKELLYKPEDVRQQYPPVWIPVSTQMSRVLQDYAAVQPIQTGPMCSAAPHQPASIPDFADVFRGYQRLALLTLFTTFGQRHKIIFVHKGNWHTLLPNLAGECANKPHFRSEAMNDSLRMDYIKANVLAYYGGYWIPPDTILLHPHIHSFLTLTVIEGARKQNVELVDTPLLVVSKKYELHTNNTNTFATDTTFMFAEPRNPTLLALANQLQVIVTKSFNNSGYEYNNYFEHTIHEYKHSGLHPRDAQSILVLPASASGSVDDRNHPVTADHYFRQRPLEHLPHPDACWCVVNSTDNRISHYPMYDWFVYLSEEAIVQNQMWIAMVYRRGLRIDSTQNQGNNYRTTVSLQEQHHPLRNTWAYSWKL